MCHNKRFFYTNSFIGISFLLHVFIGIFWNAPFAWGREVDLTGIFSARQEYESNYFLVHENPESVWSTFVTPSVLINVRGRSDTLTIRYEPTYRINQRTNEENFDHLASLVVDKRFSPHLQAILRETYIETEDLVFDEEAGLDTQSIRERRRYRTNVATAELQYQYGQENLIVLSYTNSIFDEQGQDSSDYTRHIPGLSATHWYNQNWGMEFTYTFSKADFELEADLDTHTSILQINRRLSAVNLVFINYEYVIADYEVRPEVRPAERPDDYTIQTGRMGWDRRFSEQMELSVAVGGSYVAREFESDSRGIDFDCSLSRTMQRGSFSFGGEAGFEERSFSGQVDGLSQYWRLTTSFVYQLAEKLTTTIDGLFRSDEFVERVPEIIEETIEGGVGFAYAVNAWSTLSLGYRYREVDSDIDEDDYDNHSVLLELRLEKELWRW